MKITEKLIEKYNNNRPVHMHLLKRLLSRVPNISISNQEAKYYEQLNLTAKISKYGGQVYSQALQSKDTDGTEHVNNLPADIDTQLDNYDSQQVEPLRQELDNLKNRIEELEKKAGK